MCVDFSSGAQPYRQSGNQSRTEDFGFFLSSFFLFFTRRYTNEASDYNFRASTTKLGKELQSGSTPSCESRRVIDGGERSSGGLTPRWLLTFPACRYPLCCPPILYQGCAAWNMASLISILVPFLFSLCLSPLALKKTSCHFISSPMERHRW